MNQKFILAICLFIFSCSPTPTQIPTQVPAAQLDSDVEMEAAFQQARDTLDSFIQKIGIPQANRTLVAVKVRFVLPDDSTLDL